MEYQNLTSFQLDALREVSNIGAGNSATSLSMLLGTKIDMSVPNMNLIAFDELFNSYKENEVVAVLVKVLDDIEGSILYVLDSSVALNMISKMTLTEEKVLTEMGISVLGEIGNIIASSFMNAIADFTGLRATASVPAVVNDMISAILVSTFMETGQYQDYVLDIETLFMRAGENNTEGHLYFVPAPGSLEKILESLGIK
ncbi:chemotaxis protein CheC [Clostridium sp. Sa3CUN1]|uniref:Chemotaxis protein CheC n=1 Tax=Clostridium gallinarum TaxID=2762246 RepID=A0ABR8Q7C9_9CLOT|nr:chemotaxis protein CheC [Clostridium gallinarum]MBD7916341.1 chemotaxis protein CheC [Clostridium gallinarum]